MMKHIPLSSVNCDIVYSKPSNKTPEQGVVSPHSLMTSYNDSITLRLFFIEVHVPIAINMVARQLSNVMEKCCQFHLYWATKLDTIVVAVHTVPKDIMLVVWVVLVEPSHLSCNLHEAL